jgi:hypothetical protein
MGGNERKGGEKEKKRNKRMKCRHGAFSRTREGKETRIEEEKETPVARRRGVNTNAPGSE